MQYDNLPKILRDNGKFCLWNYEERKGKVKPDKVPYQISGKRAQSNNGNTFTDYSDAVAAVSRYDGLGLGIFRGFSAVDVDHCVNADGTLTVIGQSIADIFTGCYIEKSPSGTANRIALGEHKLACISDELAGDSNSIVNQKAIFASERLIFRKWTKKRHSRNSRLCRIFQGYKIPM